MSAALREIARLRAGIEAFLSGDYPNPRQYRPGRCEHRRPYYEDCVACDTQHFEKLLAPADCCHRTRIKGEACPVGKPCPFDAEAAP